jgi:hypothetical protein
MWLLHVPCLGLLLVRALGRRVPFAIAGEGTLSLAEVVLHAVDAWTRGLLTPAKPMLYIAARSGPAALLDGAGAARGGRGAGRRAAEAPAD